MHLQEPCQRASQKCIIWSCCLHWCGSDSSCQTQGGRQVSSHKLFLGLPGVTLSLLGDSSLPIIELVFTCLNTSLAFSSSLYFSLPVLPCRTPWCSFSSEESKSRCLPRSTEPGWERDPMPTPLRGGRPSET